MRAPRWVWWTLLAGAIVLFVWGWFVLGFLGEPSAVGGVWAALVLIGGGSIVAGLLGVVASLALVSRRQWGWRLALAASVLMTLTVVGAIAGVPALVGVIAGRRLS
ncbi:MAG TPA: hypothetical protein VEN12_01120 [Verrucomicrobiae bacterium]|nr:hypothetical protein [Verrucomicrobiae bacterium]